MTTVISSGFWDNVWDVISSRVAIGIYVILMLAAVVILIVSVIVDEQKRVEPLRTRQKRAEEGEREAGSKGKETSESRFYMLTESDIRMKSYRARNMT